MDPANQRGQILIESVFVVLSIASLLILFQVMLDHQKKEITAARLSKSKRNVIHVQKYEDTQTK